jgi:glycyl-tRNA synthetase beta subunit
LDDNHTALPGLLTELHVSMQAAFGPDGKPTKALTGFAAKNGVAAEDVTREADSKGTEYVWAVRKQAGRHAAEVSLPLTVVFCADTLLVCYWGSVMLQQLCCAASK